MKKSNSRGNKENTSTSLKESPCFVEICMTHLVNNKMTQRIP